jgi:uncharacterized membrane protein
MGTDMKKPDLTWQKALPYLLLAAGIVGLAASFMLTYDKIHVLQNPDYQPLCNLNPVLSCGSVMSTPQATVLGVPNTIFGLIAFSMLTMFGLAVLAGATFKRWFWLGAQAMATAGVVFMHYLFFQSVFSIHAICPWCFVVWMITIPVFVGITVHNIRTDAFGLARWRAGGKVAGFVSKYGLDFLVWWYVLLFMILLTEFWYYWKTLI